MWSRKVPIWVGGNQKSPILSMLPYLSPTYNHIWPERGDFADHDSSGHLCGIWRHQKMPSLIYIVESLSALPSCLQKFLQYPKVWYQKKALDELNQIPPGPRPENGYFGQKLASKGQKSPSLIRVAWGQFSTFFKNYFFQKQINI